MAEQREIPLGRREAEDLTRVGDEGEGLLVQGVELAGGGGEVFVVFFFLGSVVVIGWQFGSRGLRRGHDLRVGGAEVGGHFGFWARGVVQGWWARKAWGVDEDVEVGCRGVVDGWEVGENGLDVRIR